MLQVAEVAPAFALPDQDGSIVRSDDLGWSRTLIYWYPKADTPGCSAQAQSIRDQKEAFDAEGCRVLGVSFDDVSELKAFAEKFALNFSLLSDATHEVGRQYGVAGDDGSASHARRVAYLVDESFTVLARYEVDNPEFFADRVLDDLEGMTQ